MPENRKKQVPLRLSETLYDQIAAWAEDDFRSVNGQIEYLLTECVRQRKKNGGYVPEKLDEPLELDFPLGGCGAIHSPQRHSEFPLLRNYSYSHIYPTIPE